MLTDISAHHSTKSLVIQVYYPYGSFIFIVSTRHNTQLRKRTSS
nr:MAG TPA: hypothetical protein [Herelleviridae sp.]